jgi:hypothetical protein
MLPPQTPISDSDFVSFLGTRDSLTPGKNLWLFDKIVNAPLIQDHTNFNSNQGVYKADLHFRNCTFNKSVLLGRGREAGDIYFEDCLFNENFTSSSFDQVDLKGGCVFNKNCTITSNGSVFRVNELVVHGILHIDAVPNLFVLKNININQKIDHQEIEISGSSENIEMENVFCADMIINNIGSISNSIINLYCNTLGLNGP